MTRRMKDSGVEWIGEIPEDVDIISNKYIFEYIKGRNPKELNSEKKGLPYIGASDLEKDGDNHIYKNYATEKLVTVEKDETLVLWDGARAGLIGTGHYGYIGSTIVKVIPRVDYVDKKYWYWYLKGFQPLLLDWVGGTTIPHMNRKFINEIKFINFSKPKQKAIADFLDQKTGEIDNIICKTEEVIGEYKLYKQSLITETVTKGLDRDVQMKDSGIEWIGEIPEHWDKPKMKHILSLKSGDTLTNSLLDENSKYPVYGGGKRIGFYKESNVTKENILVGRVGANCGGVTYLKDGAWATDNSLIISTINKKRYVYYLLVASNLNNLNESNAQPLITGTKVLNHKVPFVSKQDEQEQIATYLDKKTREIDKTISTKEKLLTEMEKYKKSLIYETVTGKREVE